MKSDYERDFSRRREIGRGGSSVVYKCRYNKTNTLVALKKVQIDPKYPEDLEALQTEIDIHKRIDYPLIVQFFASNQEKNTFSIFMEYCGKQTLLSYLNSVSKVSESLIKKFIIQILSSLQYIHSNKKVHGDVKLENVMIDSNNNAILIDFGLCSSFGVENPGFGGTVQYTAPEVFKYERDNTGASDIWSAGIILYSMLYGCFPFDSENEGEEKIIENIQTKPVSFSNSEIVSSDAKDLICRMLTKDPRERITLKEISAHPWIANSQHASLLDPTYTNQPELKIMPTKEEEIDQRIVDDIILAGKYQRIDVVQHLLSYQMTDDVMYYKIKKMQILKKQIQLFRDAQYKPPKKSPSFPFSLALKIPKLLETKRFHIISKN